MLAVRRLLPLIAIPALIGLTISATGCKKKFFVRDVDPEKAGKVRSLGPESQDVLQLVDMMIRSIEDDGVLKTRTDRPILYVLPMRNNTRYDFNGEVFTNLLRSELRKQGKDKFQFVSRDIAQDAELERQMKRDGKLDYNPDLRVLAPAGADLYLVGSANSLSSVSTLGQADTIVYEFRLVDAETQLDLWQDTFITKKEGKDDVIYR